MFSELFFPPPVFPNSQCQKSIEWTPKKKSSYNTNKRIFDKPLKKESKDMNEKLNVSAPIFEFAVLHPNVSFETMRENFFQNYNKILSSNIFGSNKLLDPSSSTKNPFSNNFDPCKISKNTSCLKLNPPIAKLSKTKDLKSMEKMKLEFLLN